MVISYTDTDIKLNIRDFGLIAEILIGCTRFVTSYGNEKQWHDKITKIYDNFRKKQLAQTSIINDLKNKNDDLMYTPKSLELKMSREVESIRHNDASLSLKQFVKFGILSPQTTRKEKSAGRPGRPKNDDNDVDNVILPGPKSVYVKKEDKEIHDLITNPIVRTLLFGKLDKQIKAYLKFEFYKQLAVLKYGSFDQFLRVEKTKGPLTENHIEALKQDFQTLNKLMRSKSDQELLSHASKKVKEFQEENDDWLRCPAYTEFFKLGYLTFLFPLCD